MYYFIEKLRHSSRAAEVYFATFVLKSCGFRAGAAKVYFVLTFVMNVLKTAPRKFRAGVRKSYFFLAKMAVSGTRNFRQLPIGLDTTHAFVSQQVGLLSGTSTYFGEPLVQVNNFAFRFVCKGRTKIFSFGPNLQAISKSCLLHKILETPKASPLRFFLFCPRMEEMRE